MDQGGKFKSVSDCPDYMSQAVCRCLRAIICPSSQATSSSGSELVRLTGMRELLETIPLSQKCTCVRQHCWWRIHTRSLARVLTLHQVEPPPARGRLPRLRRQMQTTPRAPPQYAETARRAAALGAGDGVFQVLLAHKGSSAVLARLSPATFTPPFRCSLTTA